MTHVLAALIFTILTTSREGATTWSSGEVDTTLAVKAGTRLEVNNFAGDIAIRTWSKNAVRIQASHSRRTRVEIERSPARIRLTATGRMVPGSVDYQLTVPPWMPLELEGLSAEISVRGMKGPVTAKSINGDVHVDGGSELVMASSMQGKVVVLNVRGRVEASSANQGVRVSDVVGDVMAESMNGSVILDKVEAKTLEASSVNGNVIFAGAFKPGGVYSLSTHNGSVVVGLPKSPDVTVQVATFSGGFSSTIPITLAPGRRGRRFSFTLGNGSAKLELESFQGSVQLLEFQRILDRIPEYEQDEDHDDEHEHEWEMERAKQKREKRKDK